MESALKRVRKFERRTIESIVLLRLVVGIKTKSFSSSRSVRSLSQCLILNANAMNLTLDLPFNVCLLCAYVCVYGI